MAAAAGGQEGQAEGAGARGSYEPLVAAAQRQVRRKAGPGAWALAAAAALLAAALVAVGALCLGRGPGAGAPVEPAGFLGRAEQGLGELRPHAAHGGRNCKGPCDAGDLGANADILEAKADADEEKPAAKAQEAVPPPGPRAQTFYMYRAQSEASYPLENINTADLAGVMWYLHNEVITATPRKYKIDRIRRYKVTVRNTWEFWNAHKRQFGAFVAYDAGRCSTPICKEMYHQYGFIVGCQVQDLHVAAYLGTEQTNWNCEKGSDQCHAPLWYSLPGPCPAMGMQNGEINPNKVGLDVNRAKTPECVKRMPGGHCDKASGDPDCTYSYEEAGEVFLDELVGIKDYNEFWNTSFTRCEVDKAKGLLAKGQECVHKKEYVQETDRGVGCSFWDGKLDKAKCSARMEAVQALFKKHYPDMPEHLEEPPCEFDMYYKDEFKWKVNHAGARKSGWWEQRMQA